MKTIVHCLAIGIFLCTAAPCVGAGGYEFQNYDNDPVLDKAWQCDSEYATDKTKVDRDKAAEYYLEYLKREDLPSFQQAKVYLQLALQYTTLADPRKGVMPDVQKARLYLEKALELEPERIGLTTIRARSFLSSVQPSRKEKIEKGMEFYGWLQSLNQEKVEGLALPLAPGETRLSEQRRASILSYAEGIKSSTATNIVDSARSMPDKEVWLDRIVQKFPDSPIAEMARKELSLLEDKASDTHPEPAAQISQPAVTPTASDQNAPANPTSMPAAVAVDGGRSPYLWPVVGAIVVAIAGGVLLAKKAGKPK